MKVAIGNLGPLTYTLKASLEELDIEVYLPEPNSTKMFSLGQQYMPSEMCYPLKILLGNYISLREYDADAVIFYAGCDMCNLSPITYAYSDIFADMNWRPDIYYCRINSKKDFILSYIDILNNISDKNWYKKFKSLSLGVKKFEAFNFIDQVFYSIRPAIRDKIFSEVSYSQFYQSLIKAPNSVELKNIVNDLQKFYDEHINKMPQDVLRIGLVGDSYSLAEPFTHQYVDKILGNMKVIVDRWTDHKLLPQCYKNIQEKKPEIIISDEVRQNYGVLTSVELKKLSNYISRNYDGIVFISPFECNPNDALRNYLTTIQDKYSIPILPLVFDEHTSTLGLNARLEAYVDLLNKKNQQFKKCVNLS